MLPVHKAVAAAVAKKLFMPIALIFSFVTLTYSQILPKQELQVNLSGYFDNFNVNVIYPSISLTRNLSDNTSITGRYLVDMITAASIKSNSGTSTNSGGGEEDFNKLQKYKSKYQSVDAVTAASGRGGGGEGISFDDVRNEFNLGITQLIGKGLLSFNGIHSSERDYTSNTVAGTFQQFFAKNDASFQLGLVKSWDNVFPRTKSWTKNKNVFTISTNFSQIISKSLILQLLASYTRNSGLLADVYKQVTLTDGTKIDPVHPDLRIRRSSALKLKYRISSSSSLETGYRYYWDSWDIKSHTIDLNYMKYLSRNVILSLGLRTYSQSRAFFFQPSYTSERKFRTVDIKLDSGHSTEYQIGFIFLKNDNLEYDLNLNLYSRHSTTPYWFNNKNNLFATNFNIGLRYSFK